MGNPASVFDVTLASSTLVQCMNTDIQPGVEEIVGTYSGDLTPQQMAVLYAEPKVTFDSGDLGGALGIAGVAAGLWMAPPSTITVPLRTRASGGKFAGSGANTLFSMTGGLLLPTSFSATQDAKEGAKVSLELYPVYDGTNAIIVATTAQDLPGSGAFNAQYVMGPAKIGSTTITGLTGITIRTGLKCTVKRYGGSPFTTLITLNDVILPEMEFTFEDPSLAATFGALFSAIGSTAIAYFRKIASGSTLVADATSQHIKFTMTGGLAVHDSTSASGNDNAQCKVTVKGLTLAASAASAVT